MTSPLSEVLVITLNSVLARSSLQILSWPSTLARWLQEEPRLITSSTYSSCSTTISSTSGERSSRQGMAKSTLGEG